MSPLVRTEDLVDATEVARLLGLSHRNSVSTYQRRYADMPRPVVDLGPNRSRLWVRAEILEWAKKTRTDGSSSGALEGKRLRIAVDRRKIERFCEKWRIKEFYFFGSVLRDDFRSDSDVDVLVEFEAGVRYGFEFFRLEEELSKLLGGRKVDVLTRRSVEQMRNWIRRKSILEGAEVYHVR